MNSASAFDLAGLAARSHGWMAAMLVIMAVATALIAQLHRRERHAYFLAGLLLSWVLVQDSAPAAWPHVLFQALALLCGAQFLLREVGGARSWLDGALAFQCALLPGLALLGLGIAPLVGPLLGAEWLLVFAAHLRLRRRRILAHAIPDPSEEAAFLAASWLLGFGAVAVLLDLAAPWLPAMAASLTGLTLPLFMLGLVLALIASNSRARLGAERQTVEIDQLMQNRLAEAERKSLTEAEARIEQVTERERKRIAADLHDDLGAKLLTIVHTSESDRISTLAREALEEMRLSVRGLTGKPVQLLDALGDWRAEVVSRLGQANIMAEWKSPAEDIIHTLQARSYVQTTRILREAVSNIIKHSGATHCTVSCAVLEGDFLVVIQDNGQGISTEQEGRLDRGHGMASMKSRAKQMQGQCLVESGPGWGTVIRLTIPL